MSESGQVVLLLNRLENHRMYLEILPGKSDSVHPFVISEIINYFL